MRLFSLLTPLQWLLWLLPMVATSVSAAPYTPASDTEVLEVLPAKATDPSAREIKRLRDELARKPQDVDTALRLARRYFDEVVADGDPRYIGRAQAALAPWWNLPDPPPRVRVMRALLLQFNHQFEPAIADLNAAAEAAPDEAGEAWAWLAAIHMVRADYVDARFACERLEPLATPLLGLACKANVDSVTGRAQVAANTINATIKLQPDADPDELLWVLTRLAEIEQRLGHAEQTEAAFRRALALGIDDSYLTAAYADFLLDQGRAEEVLTLLKDRTRSDLMLLRLTLAAKALKRPELALWRGELRARFDAARLRGDASHEKEESRFALGVQGDAARAVELAASNYKVQREPADARALLEAAIAARQPEAAAPALEWMKESDIESVVLRSLAAKLKDIK